MILVRPPADPSVRNGKGAHHTASENGPVKPMPTVLPSRTHVTSDLFATRVLIKSHHSLHASIAKSRDKSAISSLSAVLLACRRHSTLLLQGARAKVTNEPVALPLVTGPPPQLLAQGPDRCSKKTRASSMHQTGRHVPSLPCLCHLPWPSELTCTRSSCDLAFRS